MAPDLELITAIIAALKADATVSGYVGTKVFDRVPEKQNGEPSVATPYISMGPTSSVPDDFDCRDGEEITVQIDIWASGAGEAYTSTQCRKITDAVKRRLHDADLTLTENALVTLQTELVRVFRDPDGVTYHGVVQMTATVELH